WYDIAYLWLFLWRYPSWQAEIVKQFIVSEEAKIMFRMNIIRHIANRLSWFKNDPSHAWIEFLSDVESVAK
ncbi:MAG TPA: hypothetical protein PK263_04725, partial [bacterium]|nr:hypothetical protein [bacterium]